MTVLDYIVLGCFAVALIVGLIKGLWSQLFGFLGVFAVSVGSAYLYQYPAQWMSNLIEDPTWRSIAAFVITMLVLSILYAILSRLLKKLFTSIHVFKVLDKVLGMLLGVGIAYAIFALIVAFVGNSEVGFIIKLREMLGEQWTESWFVNVFYANNFFGNWLIELIASLLPTEGKEEAMAMASTLLLR